jgi:1-acyl-sn-glycerol-3-phosphate acyltransferase
VPVAIAGTQNLYFRKTLTLRFGQPIPFEKQARPKRQAIDHALATLEQALSDLLVADYTESTGSKPLQTWLNQLFW